MSKTTVIYARYSCTLQKETSIEDQFSRCNGFALQKGANPENIIFIDDKAVSGRHTEDKRPGLAKLSGLIKQGKIDMLVVDDLSRLYRNLKELMIFLEDAKIQGVRVYDTTGFDSGDSNALLITAVRGAIDQQYIQDLRHKQIRGVEGCIERGGIHGKLPYGYMRAEACELPTGATHSWVKDPETAEIVKEIFEKRANEYSYRMIARELTQRGAPSPSGKANWNVCTVQQIIRRPIYAGVYRFRGTLKASRYKQVIEVNHPELKIIDYDLFMRCQSKSTAARKPIRGGGKMWASGLFRCGCGASMTARSDKHGKSRLLCEACANRKNIVSADFDAGYIKLEIVQDMLKAILNDMVRSGGTIDLVKKRIAQQIVAPREKEISEARKQLAAVDRGLKNLSDVISQGSEDPESNAAFLQKAAYLKEQRHSLQSRIEHLNQQTDEQSLSALRALTTVDTTDIVDRLFDPQAIRPHELRAALRKIFPSLTFEGRDGRMISFWSVRFAPKAMLAFAAGTDAVDEETEILSLRVISPKLPTDPVRVEVLPPGQGYCFPGPGEKRCRRCDTVKSLSEYYRAKNHPTGVQTYCKDCTRAQRHPSKGDSKKAMS